MILFLPSFLKLVFFYKKVELRNDIYKDAFGCCCCCYETLGLSPIVAGKDPRTATAD